MESWKNRLVQEYDDLRDKYNRLRDSLCDYSFIHSISVKQADLLKRQKKVMLMYMEILYRRIIDNTDDTDEYNYKNIVKPK